MSASQPAADADTSTQATAVIRRRARSMRPRDQVFGQQARGSGFLHRAPAGVKLASLAGALILVVIFRDPVVSLVAIGGALVLAASAGIPFRMVLTLIRRVWILLAALLVAQLTFNDLLTGLEVISRVVAALLMAHLLILTTGVHELLRVFQVIVAPLEVLRLRPGRIVLAALVMLRAIPYLMDQWHQAERQARARGLERSVQARVVPVLLAAVVYAHDTGRALSARGIEEI